MMLSKLDELSTELLLKIFAYLDICDLCRLKQSCKRFNDVIIFWDHVLLKNILPLVTNQQNKQFLSRCAHQLTALEKLRISKNWKVGKYEEKSLLSVREKLLPWLYVDKNFVWISRKNKIFKYSRNRHNVNVNRVAYILNGPNLSDVGMFQIKNHLLVGGRGDGTMFLFRLSDNKWLFDRTVHDSDINSVDISQCGRVIVSGCRDNTFKIWNVNYESDDILKQSYVDDLEDRVWKVSLSDHNSLVALGTAGTTTNTSMFLYDIEKLEPLFFVSSQFNRFNSSSGILDIKWDGPNMLWTCGYDTSLRRWDLRTGKCVQMFEDPHNSALYCLDYDYSNSVMVGAQFHGRVILWDVRQNKCVQFYFMKSCKGNRKSSPIYSLSFDAESLFTATDRTLNVLNFSSYARNENNYSFFCNSYL